MTETIAWLSPKLITPIVGKDNSTFHVCVSFESDFCSCKEEMTLKGRNFQLWVQFQSRTWWLEFCGSPSDAPNSISSWYMQPSDFLFEKLKSQRIWPSFLIFWSCSSPCSLATIHCYLVSSMVVAVVHFSSSAVHCDTDVMLSFAIGLLFTSTV